MKARSLTCLVLMGCLAVACAGPPSQGSSYPDVPELVITPPEEGNWVAEPLDAFEDSAILEGLCLQAVLLGQKEAACNKAIALKFSRPSVAVNLEHPDTADPAVLVQSSQHLSAAEHPDTADPVVVINEINGALAQHKQAAVWAVPKVGLAGVVMLA